MKGNNKMNLRKPEKISEYIRLFHLYEQAFPRSEKKPISMILRMSKLGKSDLWYFEEDGKFLGLAITINGAEMVLVDYFAVNSKERSRGYGERMLKLLMAHYSPRSIFLEIEIPYEWADNYSDRVRRRRFYTEKVGLVPMNTTAKLFGIDMELLGNGRPIGYEEYREFYRDNYSKYIYDHITEADGKS